MPRKASKIVVEQCIFKPSDETLTDFRYLVKQTVNTREVAIGETLTPTEIQCFIDRGMNVTINGGSPPKISPID